MLHIVRSSILASVVFTFVFLMYGSCFAVNLETPIDCQVGVNCFIQNYVDLDAGASWKDRNCGPLSYDKHKGTDIRVPYTMMQSGVSVLAAAPGVVLGVRDGMDDISIRKVNAATIKNRECGNGVVLGHADGMQTQYCHMKKGSIRVKKGEQIQTGQQLGLVGLSGQTEFTHLHFEVRNKDGKVVCPFTGRIMESGCEGPPTTPLWSKAALASLPYISGGALASGFSSEVPDIKTVFLQDATNVHLTTLSPQFLFWAGFWGVRKGDLVSFSIHTPTGVTWQSKPQILPKDQAQIVITFGKKRSDKPWSAGSYRGEATLLRREPGKKPQVFLLSRRIMIAEPQVSEGHGLQR